MSTETPPQFSLPNAGVGPDPLSLEYVSEAVEFAVLLLLRDYHCPKCRAQVQRVAEKADQCARQDTAVIAILPDSYEKAQKWQDRYDLPFPLLADADGDVGDEYEQDRRFGVFGQLHDVIGRLPKAVLLDVRGEPKIVYTHEGETPDDRPSIEELLAKVDELQETFVFDCELVDC